MNATNKILNLTEWDYASLSKAAAAAGGPSSLLNEMYESGEHDGALRSVGLIFAGILAGMVLSSGLIVGGRALRESINRKKAENIDAIMNKHLNMAEKPVDQNVTEYEKEEDNTEE